MIRREVAGLGERLEQQEAALRAVPSAAAIGAAVKGAANELAVDFATVRVAARDSAASVKAAAEGMRTRLRESEEAVAALVGRARTREEQRQWVWMAAATGAVLGLLLWYPLVAVLPWGGGSWLAASLIGGGRWGAGAELMHEASPVVYDDMVRLYRACGEQATALCEATLAVHGAQSAGGAGGPPLTAPEGARAAAPAAPVRQGRAGQGR